MFLILLDAFLQLRIWSIKFKTSIAHVQVVILNITYHNRVITCKSSYATSSKKSCILYFLCSAYDDLLNENWVTRSLLAYWSEIKLLSCIFFRSFLCIVAYLLVIINYRKVYILHSYPVVQGFIRCLKISCKKYISMQKYDTRWNLPYFAVVYIYIWYLYFYEIRSFLLAVWFTL